MRFKNYNDDKTTALHGGVMENFLYLEGKQKIVPGQYDVLTNIFADDPKALRKIEEAVNKIKNIKSTAKSSKSGNKGGFLSYQYTEFISKR